MKRLFFLIKNVYLILIGVISYIKEQENFRSKKENMKKYFKLTFVVIITLVLLIPQLMYSQTYRSRSNESPIEKSLKTTVTSELYFTNIAIEYIGKGYEYGAYTNSDTNIYISVISQLLNTIDTDLYLNIEVIITSLEQSLEALHQYTNTGTFSDKNIFTNELEDSLNKIENLEESLKINSNFLNEKDHKSYIEKTLNDTISGALYTAFMSIGALSDCFATGHTTDRGIKPKILNRLFDLLVYIGDVTENLKELVYTYDYSKNSKDFTEKAIISFSMLKEMSNALKKYVENANSKNAEIFEQIRQETRDIINLFLGDSKINTQYPKMSPLIAISIEDTKDDV